MPSREDCVKRIESGQLKDFWELILEAYRHWDDPNDLLAAVQALDQFDLAGEKNLQLHMSFILQKGGFYEAANEILQDLISEEYTPAMCTLARIHLAEEVIDHDANYAYQLLTKAKGKGSLRAYNVMATFKWKRASGVSRFLLFFPAWFWSFKYKWAVNVAGRKDDSIR